MKHYKLLAGFLLSPLLLGCGSEVARDATSKVVVDKALAVDILIVGSTVFSGDGGVSKAVDIAICDQVICAISPKGSVEYQAKKVIDAGDLVVSPGFIDPHTHSLAELMEPKTSSNLNYLTQGVTTVVNGNDGAGVVNVSAISQQLTNQGMGTNTALLVGHGDIREQVMGRSERHASDQELLQMMAITEQAMKDGAIGLSTGLYYVPGSYASTQEVIALAKVAAKYDGIYDTHLRDESTFNIGFTQAVDEAITIVKAANIHLHLAHIKALGVDVWGQSKAVIDTVNRAIGEGVSISADQYPWQASGTHLHSAVIPKWLMADSIEKFHQRLNNPALMKRIDNEISENIRRRGGAKALLFTVADEKSLVGKTLMQVANERQISAVDLVKTLVEQSPIRVASFNMSNDDIERFMVQPWVVTSSDGTNGHPRKYASFPKKYRQYVKDQSLLSLSQFIKQSSSATAKALKIPKRGLLQVGNFADIIIFDPKTLKDNATFAKWNVLSSGVETVIVNGVITIEQGKYNKALGGVVITKH
jgi:N-acyl-D-amino-acid deacylase